MFGEVVVAQLVEWSLPMPEVRGSNPVNGKNLFISNICQLCIEKTKIKKKRPEMAQFIKKIYVRQGQVFQLKRGIFLKNVQSLPFCFLQSFQTFFTDTT